VGRSLDLVGVVELDGDDLGPRLLGNPYARLRIELAAQGVEIAQRRPQRHLDENRLVSADDTRPEGDAPARPAERPREFARAETQGGP
jgi:hypothetical protein